MKITKINLGSGNDYRSGWVNVDIVPGLKVDVVADLQKPFPFSDGSVDEIKASDILEHFTKEDGETFLKECYRVLKIGGLITIRTHNVYQIFSQFSDDSQVLIHFLYGNTEETGVFGAHKFAYTEDFVRNLLKRIGFKVLSIVTEETNYVIVAKKKNQKPLPRIIFGVSQIDLLSDQLIKKIESKGYLFRYKDSVGATILIAGDGVKRVLDTISASLGTVPIVWVISESSQIQIVHSTLLSKAIYRLINKMPCRVILASKELAMDFMMHSRVSLSRITVIQKFNKNPKSSEKFLEVIENCVIDELPD
jgi:predicted SAM-dependent methyltransferase